MGTDRKPDPNHQLRNARLNRRLTQQQIGDAIAPLLGRPLDAETIGRLERGVIRWPNQEVREAFRTYFKADSDLELGFFSKRALPNTRADMEQVSPTHRRNFIALSVTTVASGLFERLDKEPDRIHVTLDRGTTGPERVAILENTADSLGVKVVRVAPLSLLESAQTTLVSVRTLLESRQPTGLQFRLVRTMAKLNTVIGEIMFNEGDFHQARRWYKTAEHAATDAGDRYLADISLAGQAYIPTYSDDPRNVLALLAPRLDTNPAPSPAVAWLWGMRARAHATLGEINEFNHAIDMAQSCLASSADELVVPGIFSFVPEKLAFYEANCAVLLNEPQRAIRAADAALSLYDMTETTEPALAKIERASALVESGELPEACRIAVDAINNPGTYHQSVSIRTRARKFDALLGRDQSQEIAEWREVRRQLYGQQNSSM